MMRLFINYFDRDYAYDDSSDSWIEVSSQPSSSSLSSVGDEIITTGLRVQHNHHTRRRRRLRHSDGIHLNLGQRTNNGGGSSQEEYDGGESESDRVMTSSNEGIHPSPLQNEWHPAASSDQSIPSSEEDDDENATAINAPRGSDSRFTPFPNAFSYPPAPLRTASQQASVPRPANNSSPSTNRPSRTARHFSYPNSTRTDERSHSPFPSLAGSSSNHHANHDAALRASLSTLLSFGAAAARALPKSPPRATTGANVTDSERQNSRIRPDTLRLVPEDEIHGTATEPALEEPKPSSSGAAPPPARPRSPAQRKHATRVETSTPRKKARRKSPSPSRWAGRYSGGSIDAVSPTLLTWVLSAGVLVLVSALGFGAGYAVGRTEGKAEAVREGLIGGGEVGARADVAGRSWFRNGTVRSMRGWGSVKA
ncbi:hypothetical protein P152DRAFT_88989 [Eremomyces bilateralis CBS 781.70]|uniref:Uncharacterized protein n=1 Tax=Eremomyces bilateralis CBS 781.70 TaxID=1392243 RepID=A0A6G1FXW2_9PEZI|nr:uncharacterized protein P152DRAFT_88989 [Eremomyces bilateralis CBS 781.70]KAF1810552.1 hypothetical protein P152DRAFT_88989 [Eremomyces bilateralis CBS 781.70]